MATQYACFDWPLMGLWEPFLFSLSTNTENPCRMGVLGFWEESCVFIQLWLYHSTFHRKKAARIGRSSVVEIESGRTHLPIWRYLWVENWRLLNEAELESPAARNLPIHSLIVHFSFQPLFTACCPDPTGSFSLPKEKEVKEIDGVLSCAWELLCFFCELCGSWHSESSCHYPRENPHGLVCPLTEKLLFLSPGRKWTEWFLSSEMLSSESMNVTARSNWWQELGLAQIRINLVPGKCI